jgi:ferric-dicitrate binding protein FerR (iron transport regulator)
LKDVYEVIARRFSGSLSREDEEFLDAWLKEDEQNRLILDAMGEYWTEQQEELETRSDMVRRRINRKISFGESFNGTYPLTNRNITYLMLSMVVLVIVASALMYYFWPLDSQGANNSTVMKYNPKGTISKLILPDGSAIWLNAESKIYYPKRFKSEKRLVNLSGEAYFDVYQDNGTFIVFNDYLQLKTEKASFNVKAYPNEQSAEISMFSGAALLIIRWNPRFPQADTLIVDSGQKIKIMYQNLQKVFEKIENDNDLAWKDGKLIFQNTNMDEVSKKLSHWYGLEVRFARESIKSCKLTATFEHQSLEEVLNIICLSTGLDYELYGNELYLDGTGCDNFNYEPAPQ